MSRTPKGGNQFPPRLRLRRHAEFQKVWEKGRKRHTPHFLIITSESRGGFTRLGITASRKVGGAIQRNRVKRMVREFFRTHYTCLPEGLDISIIAKKHSPTLRSEQVAEELRVLLELRGK